MNTLVRHPTDGRVRMGCESGTAITFAEASAHESRFMAFVGARSEGGCKAWQGTLRVAGGYGCFRLPSGVVQARRVAFVLANKGDLPPRKVVRHTCHIKQCVSPDHLIIGSQKDNRRDDALRGMARGRPNNRNSAKLRLEQVSEIRIRVQAGEQRCDVAKAYGVSPATITMLMQGKTWSK